jgi:hypothetical protein
MMIRKFNIYVYNVFYSKYYIYKMKALFFECFLFLNLVTIVFLKQVINTIDGIHKFSTYIENISTFSGGNSVSINVPTALIKINTNENSPISVTKQNGDIATDIGQLVDVSKDGKPLSIKDYYINYTYPISTNTIFENKKANTYNKLYSDSYQVECEYVVNNVQFSGTVFSSATITDYATYSFATFGILSNQTGVYNILYSGNQISASYLDSLLEPSTPVDGWFMSIMMQKIWVINQVYEQNAMIVMQSVSRDLYFYNITLTSQGVMSLHYHAYVNSTIFSTLNTTVVTSVGINKDHLIIGTREEGLIVLNKDEKGWIIFKTITSIPSNLIPYDPTKQPESSGPDSMPVKVNDFLINQKTIYLIVIDFGLAIYDIRDYVYSIAPYNFYHPAMIQIDFLNNPFTGNKYVGISLSNGGDVNEFFLELIMDDEFVPQLNKLFTTNSLASFDNFFTPDLFFTYIYNKIDQTLIIIRRAMINTVDFELYKLDLSVFSNFILNKNPVVSIYDSNQGIHLPAILGNTQVLIFTRIVFPEDTLKCKFTYPGVFNVTLRLNGEVCKDSLDSPFTYMSCQKSISFIYQVFGKDPTNYTAMIVCVVLVVVGVNGFLLGFILVKTKCCKDFSNFKVKKVYLQRVDLYKDQQGDNLVAANKLEIDEGNNYNDNIITGRIPPNTIETERINENYGSNRRLKDPEKNEKADIEANTEFLKKQSSGLKSSQFNATSQITRTSFRKKLGKDSSNKEIINMNAENVVNVVKIGKRDSSQQLINRGFSNNDLPRGEQQEENNQAVNLNQQYAENIQKIEEEKHEDILKTQEIKDDNEDQDYKSNIPKPKHSNNFFN